MLFNNTKTTRVEQITLNANLITDAVYSGNMSTGVESVVRRTYELGQHPETTHRRLTDSSVTRSTSSPVYTIQPGYQTGCTTGLTTGSLYRVNGVSVRQNLFRDYAAATRATK